MYKRFVDNIKELPNMELIGQYGIPVIYKQNILLSSNTNSFNNRNNNCVALHFFVDDYQFDRLWNHPERYVDLFKKYEYICSPDYSLYLDFPKALQIYNTYKKQFLGAYYQSFGIKVVPTVSWSDEESYSWCFDGIEKGSCVACSSTGCLRNKEATNLFINGFEKMIEIIEPIQILMVGKLPNQLSKYSDDFYVGNGIHGDGLYFTTSSIEAGNYGESVMSIAIKKDAKIISKKDALELYEEEKRNNTRVGESLRNYTHQRRLGSKAKSANIIALQKGFDIIKVEGGNTGDGTTESKGDFYIVLNRAAVIIKE